MSHTLRMTESERRSVSAAAFLSLLVATLLVVVVGYMLLTAPGVPIPHPFVWAGIVLATAWLGFYWALLVSRPLSSISLLYVHYSGK